MTGSEPGLSPPPVSAMLIVRRKRKLPCPRLQIRAELFFLISGQLVRSHVLPANVAIFLISICFRNSFLKVLFNVRVICSERAMATSAKQMLKYPQNIWKTTSYHSTPVENIIWRLMVKSEEDHRGGLYKGSFFSHFSKIRILKADIKIANQPYVAAMSQNKRRRPVGIFQ